jgi:hypothetical protein
MGRGILSVLMVAGLVLGGVARADHTKEDAQATTAKLQAILHPPPPKRHAKTKLAPPPKQTVAAVGALATTQARATPVVDPLASLIIHAFTIPFDPKEREAHLRDIPKNAKELDAHLRRLDAALRAKHATRD